MEGATILRREVKLGLIGNEGMLFGTTKHIVNERAIQIFTTWTNEIKKSLVVFDIVFFIN